MSWTYLSNSKIIKISFKNINTITSAKLAVTVGFVSLSSSLLFSLRLHVLVSEAFEFACLFATLSLFLSSPWCSWMAWVLFAFSSNRNWDVSNETKKNCSTWWCCVVGGSCCLRFSDVYTKSRGIVCFFFVYFCFSETLCSSWFSLRL